MPSYEDWNRALLAYFTAGVPRGSPIYLGVDDGVIVEVGRIIPGFEGEFPASSFSRVAVPNFCDAVRRRVAPYDRVELESVNRSVRGEPLGLGFLCLTVLAASQMGEGEGLSDTDYFGQLRDVLQLPQGQGRPLGMGRGYMEEEPLWRTWNLWLQEQGYLPTAHGGEGARRYIGYPLTQALLREIDRERFCRLFYEEHWFGEYDAEELVEMVRRELTQPSRHLRELLAADGPRRQAVRETIWDLHQRWCEDPQPGVTRLRAVPPTIHAGLLRTEDPIWDTCRYSLYPRALRHQRLENLRVWWHDRRWDLTEDRPGWFRPLWDLDEEVLDEGVRCAVDGHADVKTLILRQRRFWILVPDPEDPESGDYADWESPTAGEPFVILCRSDLIPEIEAMRQRGLLEYSEGPALGIGTHWVEVRNCRTVAEAWVGAIGYGQELFGALRPSTSLVVSPSRGLRVPGQGGWLEGYGPLLTVHGSSREAEVRIVDVADNQVVFEQTRPTELPIAVAWPGAGDFRVEASIGEQVLALRLIKIVPWDALRLREPLEAEALELGGSRIRGALIEASTNEPERE